jgi:hypothetical protein
MLTYVIVVNDNGELKTINQSDIDYRPSDVLINSVINYILDKRSAKEEEQRRLNDANGVEKS